MERLCMRACVHALVCMSLIFLCRFPVLLEADFWYTSYTYSMDNKYWNSVPLECLFPLLVSQAETRLSHFFMSETRPR